MKKNLAILFMAIYLFGATDAGHLLKLPVLLSDYIKHREENPEATWITFFQWKVNGDDAEKNNVPTLHLAVKTVAKTFSRSIISIPSQYLSAKTGALCISHEKPPVFNQGVPPSPLVNTVFQPPRMQHPFIFS